MGEGSALQHQGLLANIKSDAEGVPELHECSSRSPKRRLGLDAWTSLAGKALADHLEYAHRLGEPLGCQLQQSQQLGIAIAAMQPTRQACKTSEGFLQ